MTKLKQFGNGFDVLYSRESNPWMREHSVSQAIETLPEAFWARVAFMEGLEGATQKLGRWTRRLGFPSKASRSCFLGSGERAKAQLEDGDWCVLGLFDRCFL